MYDSSTKRKVYTCCRNGHDGQHKVMLGRVRVWRNQLTTGVHATEEDAERILKIEMVTKS